jgi:hypothetical protein
VSPLKFEITIKICVKSQQIPQLFIQFINYVCWLLHVLALHCHPQGEFLVPSERCSIATQFSISQKALGTLHEDGNVMPKHVGTTIHD